MPESEYYSGTFGLWIDRPDKASFSIGFRPLETMAEGWNEVHYAPSTESSLRVSSTYIQDEIVAIQQAGVPVEVQPYSTELTLSEGIDNTSAQVTAVRDYVKPVDFSSSLSVLPCTRIDFESVDGKEFFIKVCDLDTEKVTSKTVFINGDTDIVLTSVDNSVDGILTDSDGESAVYSLQGIKVGISSDMSGLPAGVYIVNGRKFTVR